MLIVDSLLVYLFPLDCTDLFSVECSLHFDMLLSIYSILSEILHTSLTLAELYNVQC